jgi:hypothetical protein
LPQVQAAWQELWSSAMSVEWDRSDVSGLLLYADLLQTYWSLAPEKAMSKSALAAEIRLQRAEFGLTPLARRRLQWEVERGEEAVAKTEARRQTPKKRPGDPRLRAV